MATAITIRDVPDETRDELAARAALTGCPAAAGDAYTLVCTVTLSELEDGS
jgi:hypothetical protein